MKMSKSPYSPSVEDKPSKPRQSNGPSGMDDPENTMVTVSRLVDQLHTKSEAEKELITARLLGIARARKDARKIMGSNTQALPLLIAILRNGTQMAKVNVAATLSVLCRDNELRLKVLLGGCIPPLLALLKSISMDARRAAAEAINEVSAGGLSDDPVGMKIFVTEGVVLNLWEELNKKKQDKTVQGFVIGALRNLCGDKDGHWTGTIDGGAVDVILRLLSSDTGTAQANAASLLARVISAFGDCVPKVLDSGAINILIRLLDSENDVSARASAADALDALTSKSTKAQEAVKDANGVNLLIEGVVAPYKENMEGESWEALQHHATRALANLLGGMTPLILHLSKVAQSPRLSAPVPDILAALGFALKMFEEKSDSEDDPLDATKIEEILIKLLKPRDNKLFQQRLLGAMGSLYGNAYLSQFVNQAEGKRALVGLANLATGDLQEYLIHCLIKCCNKVPIWEAIDKKDGIQKLITCLDLSTERHQEFISHLFAVLTDQVDDSKWAITAAGGIPPLVQILEVGSHKATEDAIHVLWNLCTHSEDIRACVETASAIPALLGLLKYRGPKAQENAAAVLKKLVRTADTNTINLLMELLVGDIPTSKARVIEVLGHVLGMAPQKDLILKGTASNKGFRSLIKSLNSQSEETQVNAASVIADLFIARPDICKSLATDEIIDTCTKLLANNTKVSSAQAIQALRNLPRPAKKKAAKKYSIIEGDMKLLIKEARTSSIEDAEAAVNSLASLLSDAHTAEKAMGEDVVSAIIRVLGKGSSEGKKNASRALYQLLKRFPVGDVLSGDAQCRFAIHALLDSLKDFDMDGTDAMSTLKVIALLSKAKQDKDFTYTPLSAISEAPRSIEPLIKCLAEGPPSLQDKAIEIFSRLCGDHSDVVGDMLMDSSECIASIANRIINTSSLEVKVGGAALLICTARGNKQKTMDALEGSGFSKQIVAALVDMTKPRSNCSSLKIELGTTRGFMGKRAFQKGSDFDASKPAIVMGGNVALWLLSIISSFSSNNKLVVKEANGVEALCDKLARHASNQQAEFEDAEGVWISSMLLAILFQESKVIESPSSARAIPSLAHLLNSDEVIEKFFSAQALASLVSNGSEGICTTMASSEAVAGLISLIGYVESDMTNLLALSEEFSLVRNPDQIILENIFKIEEMRVGHIAHDCIPHLVDLLRPTPGRLTAPLFAVEVLTRIAYASDKSKIIMGECGILDALTQYLSLSPHNLSEASIAELLNILFISPDLVHRASISTLSQLIAVLHMGSRKARLNSAKALEKLFDAENIRDSEPARQAVQPLVDMLDTASEEDGNIALCALIKLTSESSPKSYYLFDLEGDLFGSLYRILTSASSTELQINAAKLCSVLFADARGRENAMASEFIKPLLDLIQSDSVESVESGVCAMERLLGDDRQAELAASSDKTIDLFVELITGSSHRLDEGCVSSLIKLGKDRPARKVDMVKAGVIDNCIEILPDAPSSLIGSIAELFRILTNRSAIARSAAALRIVEPLFGVILRPDFSLWGQHSALQALLNVLEKPQSLETLKLTPSQVMEPLIPFLESSSDAIQQLAIDLLSDLLEKEYFQEDLTSTNAVTPLVKLAGVGILHLQDTAVTALEKISTNWPKVIADADGISQISKVILQEEPLPSDELWESAAIVLSNILYSDSEYYFQVSVKVLVGLLNSSLESVIAMTISALLLVESRDPSTAEEMTEAGAVDALLDLIKSHQCEEESARLLETLVNNPKVRDMTVCRYAITPLSQYLLDPQTRSESGKLLVALCLGNLSQQEGLAKSSDGVMACRALIGLLEGDPTEEMKMVATCALQRFVMHSRANRRAVAEAGGIYVIQELLLSTNSELAGQAAALIKYLFSNYSLQEHVSNEIVKRLTAALERQLTAESTINEEILKTLHVIFTNFPKLHVSEATTQCLPHLVSALKLGSEAAQESVLDTLCVLKQSWQSMSTDIAKSQAIAAADAIPVLQTIMKTCPTSFHNRIDSLLHCLPGILTVTVVRGNNLTQSGESTSAFCELHVAGNNNGPPQQTKVVNDSTCPEWIESFTWDFDMPPKGLKLHVTCKNKASSKGPLGKLILPIDKVITEGVSGGLFNLTYESSKEDHSSRTLEIKIIWSRGTSDQSES